MSRRCGTAAPGQACPGASEASRPGPEEAPGQRVPEVRPEGGHQELRPFTGGGGEGSEASRKDRTRRDRCLETPPPPQRGSPTGLSSGSAGDEKAATGRPWAAGGRSTGPGPAAQERRPPHRPRGSPAPPPSCPQLPLALAASPALRVLLQPHVLFPEACPAHGVLSQGPGPPPCQAGRTASSGYPGLHLARGPGACPQLPMSRTPAPACSWTAPLLPRKLPGNKRHAYVFQNKLIKGLRALLFYSGREIKAGTKDPPFLICCSQSWGAVAAGSVAPLQACYQAQSPSPSKGGTSQLSSCPARGPARHASQSFSWQRPPKDFRTCPPLPDFIQDGNATSAVPCASPAQGAEAWAPPHRQRLLAPRAPGRGPASSRP